MSNEPPPPGVAAAGKPPDQPNVLEQIIKRTRDALLADFKQAKDSLDISQRLRAAEEQKMVLARGEIERQEFLIDELKQGIEARRQEGKEPGDLGAHLDHAKQRLAEAHDDLKRAEETTTNIGIAMEGLSQRHEGLTSELAGIGIKAAEVASPSPAKEQAHAPAGAGKASVREALSGLGGKAGGSAQGHSAPRVK